MALERGEKPVRFEETVWISQNGLDTSVDSSSRVGGDGVNDPNDSRGRLMQIVYEMSTVQEEQRVFLEELQLRRNTQQEVGFARQKMVLVCILYILHGLEICFGYLRRA